MCQAGTLQVQVLDSNALTLESGRAAVSPIVEVKVEHHTSQSTAQKPSEHSNAGLEALKTGFEFPVTDIGGDVILTVLEETK